MLVLSSPPTSTPSPTPPRPAPAGPRRPPANSPVSARFSPGLLPCSAVPPPQRSSAPLLSLSCPPPLSAHGDLGSRRSDSEIGLISLLFVLSVVLGSFFSLAVISLPALSAFKRLAVSAVKLSEVVSEEVPATLFSLKLSSLEINDLTSQLNNLRQRITGKHSGKKGRKKKTNIKWRK